MNLSFSLCSPAHFPPVLISAVPISLLYAALLHPSPLLSRHFPSTSPASYLLSKLLHLLPSSPYVTYSLSSYWQFPAISLTISSFTPTPSPTQIPSTIVPNISLLLFISHLLFFFVSSYILSSLSPFPPSHLSGGLASLLSQGDSEHLELLPRYVKQFIRRRVVRRPDPGPLLTPDVVVDNPVKVAACCLYTYTQHLCDLKSIKPPVWVCASRH